MKTYEAIGLTALALAVAGCKSDDAKLKELTQQSEMVNRQIQTDCFATTSEASGAGMFASPGSEEAKAWRREEQDREAKQTALDQSPHCRDLKQKQVELAGQITGVNNKIMRKTMNQ